MTGLPTGSFKLVNHEYGDLFNQPYWAEAWEFKNDQPDATTIEICKCSADGFIITVCTPKSNAREEVLTRLFQDSRLPNNVGIYDHTPKTHWKVIMYDTVSGYRALKALFNQTDDQEMKGILETMRTRFRLD